jgi:hypothetical protein
MRNIGYKNLERNLKKYKKFGYVCYLYSVKELRIIRKKNKKISKVRAKIKALNKVQ